MTPYFHHNTGRFLNPYDDIEYIEKQLPVVTTQFVPSNISTESVKDIITAIVSHKMGQVGYNERRTLASLLLLIGADHTDAVQCLDMCSPYGFSHSNDKIVFSAYPFDFIWGLFSFLPPGYKLPNDILPNISKLSLPEGSTECVKLSASYEWDNKFTLKAGEYFGDIVSKIPQYHNNGLHLYICGCSVGKTYQMVQEDDAITIMPNNSIVVQNSRYKEKDPKHNTLGADCCTWNKLSLLIKDPNFSTELLAKKLNNRKVLNIDECHGLFTDTFKADMISDLMEIIGTGYFETIRFFTGTALPSDFVGIRFDSTTFVERDVTMTKTINIIESPEPVAKMFKGKKVTPPDMNITNCFYNIINTNTGRKCLVLVNNKKQCHALKEALELKFPSKKYIVVTAETKLVQSNIDLFNDSTLGDYDGVIGTCRMFEGWNCNEVVEIGECHVIGDFPVERIQQFAHRWRKAQHVELYLYQYKIDKFNTCSFEAKWSDRLRAIEIGLESVNTQYKCFSSESDRERFIIENTTTPKGSNNPCLYSFNRVRGVFEFSTMAQSMKRFECRFCFNRMDIDVFKQELIKYGFELGYYKFEISPYADFYKAASAVEEQRKHNREIHIDNVVEHWNNKTPVPNIIDPFEQLLMIRMLKICDDKRGFIDRGVVPSLLERYKKDDGVMDLVLDDYNYNINGSIARDYAHKQVKQYQVDLGKKYTGVWLDKDGRYNLVMDVLQYVLTKLYSGDLDRMVSDGKWLVLNDHGKIGFGTDKQIFHRIIGLWFGNVERKKLGSAGSQKYYWHLHSMRSCVDVKGKRRAYSDEQWFSGEWGCGIYYKETDKSEISNVVNIKSQDTSTGYPEIVELDNTVNTVCRDINVILAEVRAKLAA